MNTVPHYTLGRNTQVKFKLSTLPYEDVQIKGNILCIKSSEEFLDATFKILTSEGVCRSGKSECHEINRPVFWYNFEIVQPFSAEIEGDYVTFYFPTEVVIIREDLSTSEKPCVI